MFYNVETITSPIYEEMAKRQSDRVAAAMKNPLNFLKDITLTKNSIECESYIK